MVVREKNGKFKIKKGFTGTVINWMDSIEDLEKAAGFISDKEERQDAQDAIRVYKKSHAKSQQTVMA